MARCGRKGTDSSNRDYRCYAITPKPYSLRAGYANEQAEGKAHATRTPLHHLASCRIAANLAQGVSALSVLWSDSATVMGSSIQCLNLYAGIESKANLFHFSFNPDAIGGLASWVAS
ncbi:MAG: hypothetical protein AAGE59_29555 [Cyanobacteria bacterium P01_F01_bin.86]